MENNRTEEILNSLDGINRSPAPDFFYTRLKARMLARHSGGERGVARPQAWYLRPVFITAGLLLVLALNAFVFLQNKNNDEVTTVDENETAQQSVAAEYSVAGNTILYDLTQEK